MKKLAVFLCSILLSMGFLTSCGMSVDSIEIESINAVLNEETGVTTVTIRYLDDIEEPLVFEIPAGQQGIDGLQGVGISEIKEKLDENGARIGITIYYTDEEKEPTFISFKDGVSIKDVQSEIQEDGSIKLTFLDDNNNVVGEPVFVPSGTEITDIKSNTLQDGSIEIEVHYSNGIEPIKFKLDAARGVSDISAELKDNKYVVKFTYTDGTTSDISFDRPTAWLSGIGSPNPASGIDGDFYFDTVNSIIWQKVEGAWTKLADLKPESVEYTVTFNVQPDFRFPPGAKKEYTFKSGECFATKKPNPISVPIPIHSNSDYEFVGWYTVDDPEMLTVNHGKFTNLTPVTGNLTLYAHWKVKSN